jgi:hypothetical protein
MPHQTFHLIALGALAAIAAGPGASFAQAPAAPAPAPAEASSDPAAPGTTAPGGRMYRWVDKDNTVHYSDRPQPGATSVPVQAPQTYSAPRVAPAAAGARPASGAARPAAPAPSCAITSPTPEQPFPNAQSVTISYRGPAGGTAELQLSGGVNETRRAPAGQSFTIAPVPRGTYTARVSILGESGVAACVTPPVTFYVIQPSLLSPVRQQMNRPQPRAN